MPTISFWFDEINEKIYSGALKVKKIDDGVMEENWYSEYKNLFQNDPQATPWVKRLCLKYEKEEGGICNLRPIQPRGLDNHKDLHSDVSETYIRPPIHMTEDNGYYIKCCYTTNAYSNKIKCVPFIMPNPYFGVCAQAAVWIALKCLENVSTLSVKSVPIPEIQKAAAGHYFSDSEGLGFANITRLLKMNNCEAFVYDTTFEPFKSFSFDEMYNIIYAYVESGLPVILGVDVSKLPWWDNHPPGYHTIVLIGHTINKKSGEIDGFILHDETKYPYLEIKKDELKKAWDIPDEYKKLMGIPKGVAIRKAVVGAPPSVKAGYEDTFSHMILDQLYSEGYINKKECPIRPMLLNRMQFFGEFEFSWKLDDPSFERFLRKRIEKVPFPSFVWSLQLHEHEKKRTEYEIIGIILYHGITGKLLLLFIENKLVLYYDTKKNQYKMDTYQKTKL